MDRPHGEAVHGRRMNQLYFSSACLPVGGGGGGDGFSIEGGGVNRAPQNWGRGGVWKNAQLTGPLVSYYELWCRRRRKFFSALKMVKFFFTNYLANDDFSEPPRRTDSKIPFSFFAGSRVWVTSEARGSVSVGFWGSRQLSPFWGRRGV